MAGLDQILDKYTNLSPGSLHGAVFIALDASGNVIYERASGKLGFNARTSPLQTDSLCWIASMTKLATAVAVMQLVERGLVSLDEDVRPLLPELGNIQVLQDFNGNAPTLQNVKGKITLRYVAFTTSSKEREALRQWDKASNQLWRAIQSFAMPCFGLREGHSHPLLFQPGTSWGYGGGVDWAGRVIERVTNVTLKEFMSTNIWSKLKAESTTYHPELLQDTLPPRLEMAHRVRTNLGNKSVEPGHTILKYPLEDDLGGIGLFSTPKDFAKLLAALIRGGNPLLSNENVDILFQPQLNDASREAMPKGLGFQMRRVLGITTPRDLNAADHCLAGTTTLRDIPRRRRKGTINWSGLPNLHWWIDRESGVAATLFTQLMPPGDNLVVDLLLELEEALYERLGRSQVHNSGPVKL